MLLNFVITSFGNSNLPSKFILKYWKVMIGFNTSLSNNYLTTLMVKSALIGYLSCWYILLLTAVIRDSNLNLLVHWIIGLVSWFSLVSWAGITSIAGTQVFWQASSIHKTILQALFPLPSLTFKGILLFLPFHLSQSPRVTGIASPEWPSHPWSAGPISRWHWV